MDVYVTKSPDKPGCYRIVLGYGLKPEQQYRGGATFGGEWNTIAEGIDIITRALLSGYLSENEARGAILRLPTVLAELESTSSTSHL